MKKILILLVVLAITAAALWFALTTTSHSTESSASTPLTTDVLSIGTTGYKVAPDKIDEQTDYLAIKGSYPQMKGSELSDEALRFNELVHAHVMSDVAAFKKAVVAAIPHLQKVPAELRTSNLYFNYDLYITTFASHTILSMRVATEVMMSGGAHPNHPYWVFNYDLTAGKELTLADIFKPGVDYLQPISVQCRREMAAQFKQAEFDVDKKWLDKGSEPKPENYPLWNMTETALLFTFAEYQVAPYVAGSMTIEIPYPDLNGLLATSL